jgi:hypothetical protein
MPEMPEILMPDQTAPTYPAAFRFSPVIETYYRNLPRTLSRNWDAYGSGSGADVPQKSAVGRVEGSERAHIKRYQELTEQLERSFLELQEMDKRLTDQVRKSLIAAGKGRAEIEAIIHRINGDAATVPIGMNKGEHILGYLHTGLGRIDHVIQDTTRSQHAHAGVIGGLVRHLTEVAQRPEPIPTVPAQPWPGRTPIARNEPPRERTEAADGPGPRDHRPTPAAPPPATMQAAEPAVRAFAEPVPPEVGSPDSDPISGNSPWRNVADGAGQPDGNRPATAGGAAPGHNSEIGGSDRAAPPVSTGKAEPSTRSDRRTAVSPWAGQHNGALSTKPARAGAFHRSPVPSAKETVVYVFPDGRTQEVTPVVAQILDAAFGHRVGTDARAAYAGSGLTVPMDTSGEFPRDLRTVVTGDIAVWGRRTAVVVVFDAANARTHDVIVEGRLRALTARMSDGQGGFGPFNGFQCAPQAGRKADERDSASELRTAPGDETAKGAVTVGPQQSARLARAGVVERMPEKGPDDNGGRVVVAER